MIGRIDVLERIMVGSRWKQKRPGGGPGQGLRISCLRKNSKSRSLAPTATAFSDIPTPFPDGHDRLPASLRRHERLCR